MSIPNAKNIFIMLFGKGLRFLAEESKRIDERANGGGELFLKKFFR